MEATIPATRKKNVGFWVGWSLSVLVILFLVFDAAIHIMQLPMVVEASNQLGYPPQAFVPLGYIELACLALFAFPRTAPLGAILLTGYLGGAIAIHVRVGSPLFSHTLFPIYTAAMLWGGVYLRDERVRALLASSRP